VRSFPNLEDDKENGGAQWVDQEVAVDDNLITSRNPGDLPAFRRAIIAQLHWSDTEMRWHWQAFWLYSVP